MTTEADSADSLASWAAAVFERHARRDRKAGRAYQAVSPTPATGRKPAPSPVPPAPIGRIDWHPIHVAYGADQANNVWKRKTNSRVCRLTYRRPTPQRRGELWIRLFGEDGRRINLRLSAFLAECRAANHPQRASECDLDRSAPHQKGPASL